MIGIFALLNFIVFIQTTVFDGCVLSTMEDKIPFINLSPTEIVKKVFFLEKSKIKPQDIEKILVALTLAAITAKFLIVLIPIINSKIRMADGLANLITAVLTKKKILSLETYMDIGKLSYIADVFAIPFFIMSSYYYYNKFVNQTETNKMTLIEKGLFFFSLTGLVCDSVFVFIIPFIE